MPVPAKPAWMLGNRASGTGGTGKTPHPQYMAIWNDFSAKKNSWYFSRKTLKNACATCASGCKPA
jgi:hypothetical protein